MRGWREGERERLGHALSVLTETRQSVNSQGMTPAQRKRISRAAKARETAITATELFAKAISEPHNGGPGYSIRSLAEKVGVSHQYFPAVLNEEFQIPEKRAKLVQELTGFVFPSEMVKPSKG